MIMINILNINNNDNFYQLYFEHSVELKALIDSIPVIRSKMNISYKLHHL